MMLEPISSSLSSRQRPNIFCGTKVNDQDETHREINLT
jgi:hypothetical protein